MSFIAFYDNFRKGGPANRVLRGLPYLGTHVVPGFTLLRCGSYPRAIKDDDSTITVDVYRVDPTHPVSGFIKSFYEASGILEFTTVNYTIDGNNIPLEIPIWTPDYTLMKIGGDWLMYRKQFLKLPI